MIFFAQNNEDVSHFLRSRITSPIHISGEAQSSTDGEIISLSRLNSILLYEPEETVISVQAGLPLDDLQQTLASKNQWIPTLLSSESIERTLGAAVAMDHFHPRSQNCGALRTTILGGTFCTMNGEIFKSGSRVVKSVAGYDIHRAFCGSQGLFGIILDLTLKVRPLPEMFSRFIAPLESKERLLQFHPTCLEEIEQNLLVELAGYSEDVASDLDQLHSLAIPIEELDETSWNIAVKALIRTRDQISAIPPSEEVEKLLRSVRRVFDPEGVLA